MSTVDAPVGSSRVLHPLDVGIAHLRDQVGQGVEQRLLVHVGGTGEEAFEELDVLLRHRPRSISRGNGRG
jgi:hypothetical protein